jgi:SAM-dependent methyltransferase
LLDEESRQVKTAKIVAILADYLPLRGSRILEVGCGGGYLSQRLAGASVGAARVCAVDTQDLRQAKTGYEFSLVSDTSLPFADSMFDVAISNHVIEHVGAADAQLHHLQEIHRVLVPGGTCYLALPNRRFPFERHFRLPLLSQLPRRMASAYVRLAGRGEYYDCDIPAPRSVRIFACKAGFEMQEITLASVEYFRRIERPNAALRLLLKLPDPLLAVGMTMAPSKMYLLHRGGIGTR